MNYVYNDAQLMLATQIAYLDIDHENISIGDAIDNILQCGQYVNGEWVLREEYQNSGLSKYWKSQLEAAVDIKKMAETTAGMGEDWRNWKIVSTCDDESGTGYYGCLIDTGDGNAIIGCRGSESYDFDQIYNDWILADVGLLDNVATDQQKKAREYMERIYYEYSDKYDTFSLTGHSLGGNLAQDMAIHAPADMRDKIDHCVSFDGPGFSQEYINANRELIEKTASRIDHYQWSWVSSLMIPLPGVVPKVIAAHDDPNKSGIAAMLFRHATYNVEFDENGYIQDGSESPLSTILGPASRFIEALGGDIFRDIGTIIICDKRIKIKTLAVAIKFVCICKLIRDVVIQFKKGYEMIKQRIAELYYKYIAPSVSGEYKINTQIVASYQEELLSAGRALDAVTDEIDSIRRSWKNWTSSGAYYRSQLMIIRNGLRNDISALKKMADATDKIVGIYNFADTRSANLFT